AVDGPFGLVMVVETGDCQARWLMMPDR
ncbi:MAG: hypothetical protein QOC58_1103, partial [Mycobacterium sp.]|nr:hypothetical protein [Mycobacterium sp.]